MSKAVKLRNNLYLDSTSIVYNRKKLNEEIASIWEAINTNKTSLQNSINSVNSTLQSSINSVNSNLTTSINNVNNDLKAKLKSTTDTPIGEFTIWEGNVEIQNNSTWHWIGEFYAAKMHLLNKFPLRSGYTRKYKIAMDYTDNITQEGYAVYLGLTDANTGRRTEYLFDLTWGSTTSGVRRTGIRDFDANTLPGNHWTIHVTPAHAVRQGTPVRIYRIYLLVYDVLNV